MTTSLAVNAISDRILSGQDGWFSDAVYWRAVAARAGGMSAVGAVLDRVSVSTARLISSGHNERIRRDHLMTVDRSHEVFRAQTRWVCTALTLVEIAFSPVMILTVVLTAGTVLVTPGTRLLAFLLLGPVAGDCAATSTRHQPGVPRHRACPVRE